MPLSPIPAKGSTDWYGWATSLQNTVSTLDTAGYVSDTELAAAMETALAGYVTDSEMLNALNAKANTLDVTAQISTASTADRSRANHTGVQIAATISDFTEAVQDAVAQLLGAGSNITLNYDDAGNLLTVTAAGTGGTLTDPETVRDVMGVALVGVAGISVAVNDAGDTITLSTTATTNSTDAFLLSRANHTGTQSADTITDGSLNKVFTAAMATKLAGIATGATNLTIGTTSTTAKAGDWKPVVADLTDSGFWGRVIVRQVDAAGVRAQIEFTNTTNSIVGPQLALKVGSADSSILQAVKVTEAAFASLTKVATTLYVVV